MKFLFSIVLCLTALPSLYAQSVTVNWNSTHQTIDGFGAASGIGLWGGNSTGPVSISSSEFNTIYNPSTGAGLDFYRVQIWPDGSYPDDPTTLQAIAAGAKVWGTSFSPPLAYKAGSGPTLFSCTGPASEHYSDFANYLVNWVQHEQSVGIPVYAISVQNEPDYCTGASNGQPFSLWTAQEFHDFVVVLGPAMAAAGLSSVKIMLPETSDYDRLPTMAGTCMSDPDCAQYVSIAASHIYSGTIAPFPAAQNQGIHLWETEISNFNAFDPSITDALYWAKQIHNFMTVANANAWNWWVITLHYGCDNSVLLSANTCSGGADQQPKRLWAIANWAKFVRPGWVRIDATASPAGDVYVSAFKDPSSGKFAIVVVNQNANAVDLNFSLSGFPSVSGTTPALTSSSADLVDQSNVTISGGAFSYSVPGSSIVTFHSSAVSTTSSKPAAPANLSAIIR